MHCRSFPGNLWRAHNILFKLLQVSLRFRQIAKPFLPRRTPKTWPISKQPLLFALPPRGNNASDRATAKARDASQITGRGIKRYFNHPIRALHVPFLFAWFLHVQWAMRKKGDNSENRECWEFMMILVDVS